MSLGSFLANAGAGIEDIDVYRTERELRGLQRDAAAEQRAAMRRADVERARLANVRKFGEQFTDVSGVIAPPEAGAAGLLPSITPPPVQTPAPSQAGLDVPTGIPVSEAPSERPGIKGRGETAPPATPVTFRGVTIPGTIKAKGQDRLGSGVAGFTRIDPNASDAKRAALSSNNSLLLNQALDGMATRVEPLLSTIRKPFAPQDEKRQMEARDKAAKWYRSSKANTYFRQNPELLAVARRDPLGFHQAVLQAGKKGAPAPKPADTGGAAPQYEGPSVRRARVDTSGDKSSQSPVKLDETRSAVASILYNGGLNPNVIAGFLGNFEVEGGYTGRLGDNGSASGIAQWREGRRANFRTMYGKDPHQATPAEQAQFVLWELRNPGEAGMTVAERDRILAADSPRQAASLIDRFYERSDGTARARRAQIAEQFAGGDFQQVSGSAPQQAGLSETSVAQQPPLNLTNLNSYLGDPNKIGFTASNEIRKREVLKREALIYAESGNEAAYQQSLARVQEADANLLRLMGAQAIVEVNNFNNPARAQQLLSLMSGGQLQVRMREDGRFAFLARNQQGEFVPVPGQENVSRAEFLSTMRKASDEVYRTQMEQAEAQIAMLQVKDQQDIGLEILKGKIAGELQTQRLGVDLERALIMAEAQLQAAKLRGEQNPIASLGEGANGEPLYVMDNPANPNDPYVFSPSGFQTPGPGGETITNLDAIPLSQYTNTQR
jgi:hypothetical protein